VVRTICSEIHKFITSVWNKEELPEEWNESIIVPIYKKDNEIDFSNYRGISILSTTYKILSSILSMLTPYAEEIIGDFDARVQLLIIYAAFVKYLRKSGNIRKQFISYLKTSRNQIIQLGRMSCTVQYSH
jgi:hypothetical protein